MSDPTSVPKLLISVLSTAERHGWHHPSLSDFLYGLRFENRFCTNYAPINNFSPAASGRNVISKHFVDSEADWLMMIDNDMVLPANILDTLKDVPADAGIVCPTFYLWDGSKPSVTLCWGVESGKQGHIEKDGKEYFHMVPGFHELTKCGTGVIFIRREVFDKLEYPYFKYIYNDDQGMQGTEDLYFCKKAREKGIKIYGNSIVRVGHMHQVNLLTLADMIYNGLGIDEAQKPVDTRKANGVSSAAEIAERPLAASTV